MVDFQELVSTQSQVLSICSVPGTVLDVCQGYYGEEGIPQGSKSSHS